MERFLKSIEMSISNENWYGALVLALSMPDICAKVTNPNMGSKARYIDWYNRYMKEKYTSYIGADKKEHIFLCAEDCYALRCSFLHEGGDNIENQRAREVLKSFHFTIPQQGFTVHMNQTNQTLQLQIDIFCTDVCESVRLWSDNENINDEHLNSLISLYDVNGNKVT